MSEQQANQAERLLWALWEAQAMASLLESTARSSAEPVFDPDGVDDMAQHLDEMRNGLKQTLNEYDNE
jgi:hypothetical protein